MVDFLNYGFAWIAVLLAVILAVVYITRKIAQTRLHKKENAAKSLDRTLRKPHKVIGLFLIMAGLVHGLASSDTVWSLNVGTVCWVFSILLGINWVLRSKLKACGGWLIYHRIITVVFLLSIVWHVADVGGIRVFEVMSNPNTLNAAATKEAGNTNAVSSGESAAGSAESPLSSAGQDSQASAAASSEFSFDGVTLKDGAYTGSADGYGPNLTVSVTVEGGKVAAVDIVSHNEKKSRYYAAPIEKIPAQIVDEQTLDVDIISGATYTSAGIVNAVIDALSGAVVEGRLPDPILLNQNRRR